MRTLIILVAGTVLAAVSVLASRRLLASTTFGLTLFLAAWLVVAAVNMWIGVRHAGYSIAEELPIFLLIFILPAAIALLVAHKFK